LVEALSAAGAIWLYIRDPRPGPFAVAVFISGVLLLVLVIDMEHRLILHTVIGPAAVVVGLIGVLDPGRGAVKTLLGGLAGFGLVYGLYLLGEVFARLIARVRRQALDEVAFGFGDVTLAGLIGLAVGWPGVLVALFVGILLAGLFSLIFLVWMILRRRYVLFSPIPYGPFLILGAWVVYFGGRAGMARLLGV
jgi:prepilin signal peptidase PulO-like enzyme (type II secretory pathway)